MRTALDDEFDGWFEVDERTDHAQAAIDAWREANKKPGHGVFPVVVFTDPKSRVKQAEGAPQVPDLWK
jgi:hypothetical protein